jgi:nucleoside-diphosphate-sugar epimerase
MSWESATDLDARLGRVLVTGGGGFVGSHVVRLLREGGVRYVTAVGRREYTSARAVGARSLVADVADAAAIGSAIATHDTVVHTAALAGVWGARREYERTNVLGTRNVVAACRTHGVARLVFTSSPSVVFDGTDHVDASNQVPHATRFLAHYPRTKAQAERDVLAANGPQLATVALRPHLVFGPGDPHLVPRLVERARDGRLAKVGRATNRVSLTFVENAAHAHLDAAVVLTPTAPHAGRAYFVNQSEPVVLWQWIDELLAGLGLARSKHHVSAKTAYGAGALCEFLWRVLPLAGEPPMTRFVAQQMTLEHTYSLAPAQRDFGYRERVTLADATARTVEALRADARGSLSAR